VVRKVIIVTGAAGFIGSSLVVALSKEYNIIAIDKRKPTPGLVAAAPDVRWEAFNIADSTSINHTFQQVKYDFGKIDFLIHLAAYYHFGNEWTSEYEKTNISGTENIIKAAIHFDVKRVIFASSVAAMEPPSRGHVLNERSHTSEYFPYAKSKSEGEKIIKSVSRKIPSVILRLGGVFSDWCELPPLYSLTRMWSGIGPLSKIIPGRGETGIPYIHISDVIHVINRCIQLHDQIGSIETFIASQKGTVLHNDLFSSIKQSISRSRAVKPIYFSPSLVKFGLHIRLFFGLFMNQVSVEQPWMLKFIDKPWIVDNTYTQRKLNWTCSSDKHILKRLPVILKLYEEQKTQWVERNLCRISGNFNY